MHELSIAISIVDLVIDQAGKASADRVSEVELDIGTHSGIEYEALEFALGVASNETMLEKTLFRINRVEPVAECPACQHLYTPEGLFSYCPKCNEQGIRLIQGTELQVKSLLVEQNE
ncbi:MAG: hydrogenase maturation nickel metallochaperone HypA [Bacteroidota bacterium]|nr:hydrogenase maturation nickel metallochaperone HypA [Bacteroidota bacterium]